MVTVKIGDLFQSQAQTLVNTVNCVGVMGKGVALEFRERFRDMYEDYVRRCEGHELKLGRPYIYKRLVPPWVLNFPTKAHWRSVSTLADIEEGLEYLKGRYRDWGITSLAVPPLGCGQGQLEWRVVGPSLYRHLKSLDIPVELYAPFGTPHEELRAEFLDPSRPGNTITWTPASRIEPGWLAVVAVLYHVEREPYHWPVGRVAFQKIAYFVTESGIPTGLDFQRGSFGPHASELKRKITILVNNGLIREQQLGRMFAVHVGETFLDAVKAYSEQLREWKPTIRKIADLFLRMDTQEAEVAATVHFAAKSLRKQPGLDPTEKDVLKTVLEWKIRRRPPLNAQDVAIATRNLNLLSWLNVQFSADLPVPDEESLYA